MVVLPEKHHLGAGEARIRGHGVFHQGGDMDKPVPRSLRNEVVEPAVVGVGCV